MIIHKPQSILLKPYIYIYIYININNGGDYVSEISYKIISKIITQIYKGDITEW